MNYLYLIFILLILKIKYKINNNLYIYYIHNYLSLNEIIKVYLIKKLTKYYKIKFLRICILKNFTEL